MKILRYFVSSINTCTCLMLGKVVLLSEYHRTFVPNLTSFLLSFVVCIALTEAVSAMTETSSGCKTSSIVTEIRTKIFQWPHQWGRTSCGHDQGVAQGLTEQQSRRWGATLPLNPGSALELDAGKQPPQPVWLLGQVCTLSKASYRGRR